MGKRSLKRGSGTVKVAPKKEEEAVVKIRDVDDRGKVKVTHRKKYGRYDAMFVNKEGHFQYLVAYNPAIRAALFVVRPLLKPLPLPSLDTPPSEDYQGEIIGLRLNYLDDDSGYREITYDAAGKKYLPAYKRWMKKWDELCENI